MASLQRKVNKSAPTYYYSFYASDRETMADYYRERLDEVYREHTSLSDKIENFVEKALDVALAFVLPIVIVGVMAAICILYPPAGLIVKDAMVIGCASLVVMPDSIMPDMQLCHLLASGIISTGR